MGKIRYVWTKIIGVATQPQLLPLRTLPVIPKTVPNFLYPLERSLIGIRYKILRGIDDHRAGIERKLGLDKTPIEQLAQRREFAIELQSDLEAAVIYLHILDLFHAGETSKVNAAVDALLKLPQALSGDALVALRFLKAVTQRDPDNRRTFFRQAERDVSDPRRLFVLKALRAFHQASSRQSADAYEQLAELRALGGKAHLQEATQNILVALVDHQIKLYEGRETVLPADNLVRVRENPGASTWMDMDPIQQDVCQSGRLALDFMCGRLGAEPGFREAPPLDDLPRIFPVGDRMKIVDLWSRQNYTQGDRNGVRKGVAWLLKHYPNHLGAITMRNQLIESKRTRTRDDWEVLNGGLSEERALRMRMRTGGSIESHTEALIFGQSEAGSKVGDVAGLDKLLGETAKLGFGSVLTGIVGFRAAQASPNDQRIVERASNALRDVNPHDDVLIAATPPWLLDTFFGSRDPAVVREHLRILSGRTRKLAKLSLHAAMTRPADERLSDIYAIAHEYGPHETRMFQTLDNLLRQAEQGVRRLYDVQAYLPYIVLVERGMEVVHFKRDRVSGHVHVSVEFQDGVIVDMGKLVRDFEVVLPDIPANISLARLLTCAVIDFFNLGQLGSNGYQSVFEQMDTMKFESFATVDFAELRRRLGEEKTLGVVAPTPTPEEEAIQDAAAAMNREKNKPSTQDAAALIRKAIFRSIAYPEYPQGKPVVIDVHTYFSGYPVSRLLEYLEVRAGEKEMKVRVRTQGQLLEMTIFPDGSCRLDNQNRGFTDLHDWQLFSATILDILTGQISPDYRHAIGLDHPEDALGNIFTNACHTPTAIAQKKALYEEIGPEVAGFAIEAGCKLPNPFDSLFFEVISKKASHQKVLRPRPELTTEKLPHAMKGDKEFVMLAVVGVHLRKNPTHPASRQRKLHYIEEYVLPSLPLAERISGNNSADIILSRIAAGENLDPQGYLVAAAGVDDGADFVKSVEVITPGKPRGEQLAAHYTYVRSNFRILSVTGRSRRRPYLPRTSGSNTAMVTPTIASVIDTRKASEELDPRVQTELNREFQQISGTLHRNNTDWWHRASRWSDGKLDAIRLRQIHKKRANARWYELELLRLYAQGEGQDV